MELQNNKSLSHSRNTIVSFVLDESGSMKSCKGETIAGFNKYLETLKSRKGAEHIRFNLTRFSTRRVVTCLAGARIADVPTLRAATYQPDGGTPLYDAIGRAIDGISAQVAGLKDQPAVLVVIMTDGQENSSKDFDLKSVFALITEKTQAGWTFVFLGANQDAHETGASLGVAAGNVTQYVATPEGTVQVFFQTAASTKTFLDSGSRQGGSFFGPEPKKP